MKCSHSFCDPVVPIPLTPDREPEWRYRTCDWCHIEEVQPVDASSDWKTIDLTAWTRGYSALVRAQAAVVVARAIRDGKYINGVGPKK